MAEERLRYVTVDEAAKMLRVAPQTVYRWCRSGRIPALKVGKEWRIPADSMMAGADLAGRKPPGVLFRALAKRSENLLALAADRPALARLERALFEAAAGTRSRAVRVVWGDDATAVTQRLRTALARGGGRGRDIKLAELSQAYEAGGVERALSVILSPIEDTRGRQEHWFIYASPGDYFGYQSDRLIEFARRLDERVRGLPVLCTCAYALTDLFALYEGRALALIMELVECHSGLIWFDGEGALLQRSPGVALR